jgi:hypothetical protein
MKTWSIFRVRVRIPMLAVVALFPLPGLGQSSQQLEPDEAVELVHGRQATVRVEGATVKGELLAVTADSLWLLTPGAGLRVLSMSSFDEVRVRRHDMTTGRALLWAAIGATITGVALSAACGQVDDADCGGLFPSVVLAWGVVGGLFSWRIGVSARHLLPPVEAELRPYARFPQGLLPGFDGR